METFEFSLVFRHTSRTDKNLKVRFHGADSRLIGDQATAWFGQHLRARVHSPWQMPTGEAVLAGITEATTSPGVSAIICGAIDGVLVKVRRIAKPSAARKAALPEPGSPLVG